MQALVNLDIEFIKNFSGSLNFVSPGNATTLEDILLSSRI